MAKKKTMLSSRDARVTEAVEVVGKIAGRTRTTDMSYTGFQVPHGNNISSPSPLEHHFRAMPGASIVKGFL